MKSARLNSDRRRRNLERLRFGTARIRISTINWANHIAVKSVQYIKMGHAPDLQAKELNDSDFENTVRETGEENVTDLQMLLTENTNDPKIPNLEQKSMEPIKCTEQRSPIGYHQINQGKEP